MSNIYELPFSGFRVGHAEDTSVVTGTTACVFDEPAVAAVHIMGASPGTRETELLNPEYAVAKVDAIVLSGGSAFGLDAAGGCQAKLKEEGRGIFIDPVNIPIVPSAILFDMRNEGNKDWGRFSPYRELGYEATSQASNRVALGSAGAAFGASTANTKGGFKQKEKIQLSGAKAFYAFSICFVVFFLSFLFPLSQMLYWTLKFPENLFDIPVITLTLNTLYLVLLSSLVLITFSLISNYGNRVSKNKILNVLSTLSISGYAIPGVILAIAFISFIAWFDNSIIKSLGFDSIKKVFIGSILGLVLVYFVRFYSLAFNGIKSGYEKINISVDESAYLLGYSKRKTFMNIHIPFLRNSLLFIIILISLEIIRELPITLILRPFNFETFATTAYISASEDLLEAAAVPSLFLILIASLFIIISSKYILRENNE